MIQGLPEVDACLAFTKKPTIIPCSSDLAHEDILVTELSELLLDFLVHPSILLRFR